MFWLRCMLGLTRTVHCWRIKTPYSTLSGEGELPWWLVRDLKRSGIGIVVHSWEEER